ncbi:MAG TPA: TrmH family RNA methyltransferase [Fibrobacteria bacterium]|nr:TrmH family RNA methyltransferase [Fibrobacteria bacterium]
MILSSLEIVLVRPETPRNVGSVARAGRNFGVERICIVGSPALLQDGAARATAHGAEEILDRIRFCADLEEALSTHVFAVGTANRVRKGKLPPLEMPHALVPELAEASRSGGCALVFGPESRGLTDVELGRCTRLLRLPTEVDQPSLNLSQAVLLTLQECWRAAKGWSQALPPGVPETASAFMEPGGSLPTFSEFDLLLGKLEGLMERTGFRPYAGDPESFRMAARRSLSRGRFERRDLRTLLTIAKTLERLPKPRSEG